MKSRTANPKETKPKAKLTARTVKVLKADRSEERLKTCCKFGGAERCKNFHGPGSRSQATGRIETILCSTAADSKKGKAAEVTFGEADECRARREKALPAETEDAPPSPSD